MERLLTGKELANKINVSPGTLRNWCHEGFIPRIKVGRLVRYRESDVEAWLKKRSKPGRVRRRICVDDLGM